MSTMQAFYNQIALARETNGAHNGYWARLAQLTRATLAHMTTLNLAWLWWG